MGLTHDYAGVFNGLDGIRIVEAERPDVVLLDLVMPVMDGLEAIPRIVETSPRTRIVVLSGVEDHLGREGGDRDRGGSVSVEGSGAPGIDRDPS